MRVFKRFDSDKQSSGLERKILNSLPYVLIGGTLLPIYIALFTRMFFISNSAEPLDKVITGVDILSISVVITLWTAAFTIAIGCVIVIVMKGPALLADSIQLQDSRRPGNDFHNESKK